MKARSDWLVKQLVKKWRPVTREEITQIEDEHTKKATKFGLAVFKKVMV